MDYSCGFKLARQFIHYFGMWRPRGDDSMKLLYFVPAVLLPTLILLFFLCRFVLALPMAYRQVLGVVNHTNVIIILRV